MKVCVIGGGSTYTPELIEGLLDRRSALGLTSIHLVDHDAARLGVLGPLAARMAAAHAPADATASPVTIDWSVDRRAGIPGAAETSLAPPLLAATSLDDVDVLDECPRARLLTPRITPVAGAVLLALELHGRLDSEELG